MPDTEKLGSQDTVGSINSYWRWAITASFSTLSAFATTVLQRLAITTLPAESASGGIGVIRVGPSNQVVLKPAGSDADAETFTLRVYGVRRANENVDVWERDLLCVVTCTLCATVVPSGVALSTTLPLYCDALSVTDSSMDPAAIIVRQPGSDIPATLTIDAMGFEYLETQTAINSGTAASHNVRYFTV